MKCPLNKSTIAIREAILSVFADLQVTTGRENGHLLKWALRHPSDFYRMGARLLSARAGGADGGPNSMRIDLSGPVEVGARVFAAYLR